MKLEGVLQNDTTSQRVPQEHQWQHFNFWRQGLVIRVIEIVIGGHLHNYNDNVCKNESINKYAYKLYCFEVSNHERNDVDLIFINIYSFS